MTDSTTLAAAFNLQAYYCRDLDSPFMGEICEIFAENLSLKTEVGRTLLDWPGDVTAGGASLPLRLMGCLHRLVISGECPELVAIYPPNDLPTAAWHVFEQALIDHKAAILHQLRQAPQTNEVRRAGVLLPGFCAIASQTPGLPFILSEVGASAGLNLNWDQFAYAINDQVWGDPMSKVKLSPVWKGPDVALCPVTVTERSGCDINPIDIEDETETETLLSYLWADQHERLSRTRAAIEIALRHPYTVERQDAVSWLTDRLSRSNKNHVHVIYHTIARQYFSDADKQASNALIEATGAQATPTSPLAWLRFEADGKKPGAALTLRLWNGQANGGEEQFLGRADYHGRWIDWSG